MKKILILLIFLIGCSTSKVEIEDDESSNGYLQDGSLEVIDIKSLSDAPDFIKKICDINRFDGITIDHSIQEKVLDFDINYSGYKIYALPKMVGIVDANQYSFLFNH